MISPKHSDCYSIHNGYLPAILDLASLECGVKVLLYDVGDLTWLLILADLLVIIFIYI